MKIGLAQIECMVGDSEANCAKITDYIGKAAQQGCDVVVFPEMSDTGYDMSLIKEIASSWAGRPFLAIKKAAARYNLCVICGLSEREDNQIYNSRAVISADGRLLEKYRKVHLFSYGQVQEKQVMTPGSLLTTLNMGGITWGFSICYDLRFPELYRALALMGEEVVVNCSAWPAARATRWEVLTKARALENQSYFIGVNRVGADGELLFCGNSCLIDPYGENAALGSGEKEELIIGEIEKDKIVSCRNGIPVFRDRREDIYGNLGV